MTTLAIMATYEKKRLKCYGTVAAGEHVAVTVTDGAQWIGEGTALRLRVLFGPDTVAVFPFADGDTWTAAGTQDADAACELNLNTLQAEKYLKRGGTCLWILDDVENHTLYATGEFDVLPWPKRRGIDEPIDLDGYPLLLDEIKDLKEAFEEYQRTVAQMLATKQDTIFDLATIRSGAAAGATAVQPSQIARFVDDAEYKAQYGEQNKPAILFKHGTNVIVALDATPFVRDGMVSDVKIENGNLVITFNTDSGKQPISIPLTDIFNPDNYYTKTDVNGLLTDKLDKSGGTMTGSLAVPLVNTQIVELYDNGLDTLGLAGNGLLNPNNDNVVISWPSLDSSDTLALVSQIYAAVQQIAPDFTAKAYVLNELCSVGTDIYRCKSAYTSTGNPQPVNDSTHWVKATVEDVLAALRTALAGKASKSDVDPLLFAQYYPDGNVKSAAEFTSGIKYDDPDTVHRTITVKPFCNTGTAENDNSSLVGRVVIPPFVDASGNPYISDDGTRYRVVGVSGSLSNGSNVNLTAIIAPNTVTNIGGLAFIFCTSLESISLPAATTIGDPAFAFCTSLASVDFGDTPRSAVPSLGSGAFDSIPTTCKIIVPYTQYDAWIAAENWRDLPQEFVRHAEKADKPATFTAGNLAKFDANGNPTDSGIKPSAKLDSTSAADEFSTLPSRQYVVGEHCTYNGNLYICTTQTTGGTWDSTCWHISHLPTYPRFTAFGNLVSFGPNTSLSDSGIAKENVALKGNIPYAISESIPLTVTSGAAATTLDDRTHNVRTVAAPGSGNTTTITATLPPIIAGKSRDMFINLTVGTQASDAGDISLSIVEPGGAEAQIDIGGAGNIGIGKNEILLTENALPTTSGNVTTTHWLVTVRHEDFAS